MIGSLDNCPCSFFCFLLWFLVLFILVLIIVAFLIKRFIIIFVISTYFKCEKLGAFQVFCCKLGLLVRSLSPGGYCGSMTLFTTCLFSSTFNAFYSVASCIPDRTSSNGFPHKVHGFVLYIFSTISITGSPNGKENPGC